VQIKTHKTAATTVKIAARIVQKNKFYTARIVQKNNIIYAMAGAVHY
jgi:hypothetical protein